MLYNLRIEVLEANFSWNGILFLLLGCSVLSVAIFIERYIVLQRSEIDTNRFLLGIRDFLQEQNVVAAIAFCEQNPSTVAQIVKTGLRKSDKNRSLAESAMETSGALEIARLEKNAKILSVIAHTAPLIGLLGTVLGFMQAFAEMRTSGLMDISTTQIGEAMEYALVTTAAGLAVAIPTGIAYNYIVSRIEHLVLEMRVSGEEILDLLFEV